MRPSQPTLRHFLLAYVIPIICAFSFIICIWPSDKEFGFFLLAGFLILLPFILLVYAPFHVLLLWAGYRLRFNKRWMIDWRWMVAENVLFVLLVLCISELQVWLCDHFPVQTHFTEIVRYVNGSNTFENEYLHWWVDTEGLVVFSVIAIVMISVGFGRAEYIILRRKNKQQK